MNVLLLSLLYPDDQLTEISQNAKDKLQNQINSYQRAFISGIRQNLLPGEKLDILNCLPVGVFPLQYRQLFLKNGTHDDGSITQLGCINLPWLKREMRFHGAARFIKNWAKRSPENRMILVYTQYVPYLQAILEAKKHFPDLKSAVIVTDLPNELGLPSGRKGLLKKLEYKWGNQSVELLRQMDGLILLTEPMAEALCVEQKPYTVIEGLILPKQDESAAGIEYQTEKSIALYTGTLEPGLGIREMLQAFEQMPQYELWICGQGSMQQEVERFAERCVNIRYYGFIPQKEALALQARATMLINPRQPEGIFTRYSFPSKTLEYMRSGKPTLCCRLEGIPADYDAYLWYIEESGSAGIMRAVQELMQLPESERKKLGESSSAYVQKNKNPKVQCEKLMRLLRSL